MQCGVDVFQHNGVIAAVYSGGKTVADFMRNNESGLSTAAKKLFTKLNIQYTTISQIVVMILRSKTIFFREPFSEKLSNLESFRNY